MKTALLMITLLTLSVGAASAHELTAPATVAADGAGHFSFTVMLHVTVTAANGSIYINGLDNTDVGESIADGFCISDLAPGFYPWTISGNLTDLSLGGSVSYEHSLCDGWIDTVTVNIIPPAVGLELTSWSTIKARYR